MSYTVGIIIIVATMLAILGYVIRGSLVAVREQFDHTPLPTTSPSGEEEQVDAELERLKNEFSDSISLSSEVTLPEPPPVEETTSSGTP